MQDFLPLQSFILGHGYPHPFEDRQPPQASMAPISRSEFYKTELRRPQDPDGPPQQKLDLTQSTCKPHVKVFSTGQSCTNKPSLGGTLAFTLDANTSTSRVLRRRFLDLSRSPLERTGRSLSENSSYPVLLGCLLNRHFIWS